MNERDEERAARHIMSSVLGVEVTRHDDGSLDRMVDFHFTLADGRLGAAEMTTITDGEARKFRNEIAKGPFALQGATWEWKITPSGSVRLNWLKQQLLSLESIAKVDGLRSINNEILRSPHYRDDSVVRELLKDVLTITGNAETNMPGTVHIKERPTGAFEKEADAMLDWIDCELQRNRYDPDFAKLESSGRPERHLFLRVDLVAESSTEQSSPSNGMPVDLWMSLTADAMPSRPPRVAQRAITGLWLFPEMGWSGLWWSLDSGWHRIPVHRRGAFTVIAPHQGSSSAKAGRWPG